jgi:hypothetical protein
MAERSAWVGTSSPSLTVFSISRVSISPFTASCVHLQLRPLPSTSITRLHQYYEPLRHPIRPGPSLASRRLIHTAITAGASRVAPGPLLPACRRHYPGRFGGSCSLVPFPLIGLPRVYGGSAPASWFSRPAQRSLTLRPACLQSRLRDPSTPEASASLLPPPLLRLLPGGTNQFPGGNCTHC